MKSSQSTVLAARSVLSLCTPLKADCGRLCGDACCQGSDEEGMLLFPGEAALYADCTFGHILPTHFALGGETAALFVCEGSCPRAQRPLSCRLFPLLLAFDPSGEHHVTLDPRAHAVCPLCDYGLTALDPAFLTGARCAYDLLLADPACARFLHDLYTSCTL